MSAIRVELELDDGSFTTRMIHAGETIAQFNRNVGQTYVNVNRLSDSHRDLLGTLRDVTVILGTVRSAFDTVRSVTTGWIGDIIKTNAEIQRTTVLLRGMSKAADPVADANKQMTELRELSKNVPYSLQVLTKTFVQMKATGIDPMKGSMTGLIDAVSAMGGAPETLNRASLAMTQMAGKGVIQMEELRQQLGEAVPRATELMARSMGVTYDQLVKAIGTGTVSAKPALELLRLEFDRTFGGAAKANMETYDGLISRIGTSFQTLQLKVGGDQQNGFFAEVQRQLKDLLVLMESKQAEAFAKGLGDGLKEAILAIRSAIDIMVQYKGVIVDVGKAILVAFAVSRAISGIQSLVGVIGGLTSGLTALRAQWQANTQVLRSSTFSVEASVAAHNALAAAQLRASTTGGTMGDSMRAFGNQMLGLNPLMAGQGTLLSRLTSSTTLVGGAARFATVAFAGLGVAMNFLVGWLPLIVTGIMIAGEKFGWFSDRAGEARDELNKFGATGQKQVRAAFDDAILDKESELRSLEKIVAYNKSNFSGPLSKGVNDENDKLLTSLRADIAALRNQREARMSEAIEAEQKAATQKALDSLEKEKRGRQQIYDQKLTAMEAYHKAEREKLIKAGQSTTELDKIYQETLRKNQRKVYEDEIASLEAHIAKKAELAEKGYRAGTGAIGDEAQNGQAARDLSAFRDKLEQARQTMASFDATNPGVPTLQKQANEAKAIEKLQAQLVKIEAASEGVRAEMAGASSDAAKLAYELENSSKIPKGNPFIEDLIAKVRTAATELDGLEKKLKAQQELQRDIDNAAKKAAEEAFELQYGHLSEVDKIMVKAQNGLYGPLGDSALKASGSVNALAGSAGDVNAAATKLRQISEEVGRALAGAFNESTQAALERARQLIEQMAGSAGRLKTLTDGLDLNKAFSTANPGSTTKQFGTFGLGGPTSAITGVSATSLEAMVRTVIAEARGEGNDGMQAVAEVIRNRSLVTGRDVGQIVQDPKQFSPWNTAGSRAQMYSVDPNSEIYQRAATIVQGVLSGTLQSLIGDRTSFANPRTSDQVNKDGWIAQMIARGDSITKGNHVFGYAGYGGRSIDKNLGGENLSSDQVSKLLEIKVKEAQNIATKAQMSFDELLKTYTSDAAEFATDQNALGTRMKALRKQIEQVKPGQVNTMNPDGKAWDDPYWDKLKAGAEAADKAEQTAHDNEAARRKAKTAAERMADKGRDYEEVAARASGQIQDPYSYKKSNSFLAQERDMRRMVDDRVGGGDDRTAVEAEAKAKLNTFIQSDIAAKAAGFARETDTLRQSLMTQGQARQEALDKQIQALNGYLSAYEQAGGREVAVVEAIEAKKTALRQAAMAAGPIAQRMKEWGDWSNQLEVATTNWMSSFSDKFAEMVVDGKADFAELTNAILKDIIKIGIQWTASSIFKSFLGIGGIGGGGGFDLSSLFGAAHVGGIVGNTTMSRSVSPLAFAGAPRFHTGGIISPSAGIRRGEVPIVALEGEGVFTREQMAAMGGLARSGGGGGGVVTIAPIINLSASGGTPEQNSDLAKRVGQQLEGGLRNLVCDELRKQGRPNGLLSR